MASLIQAVTASFPNSLAGNTANPVLPGVQAGNAIIVCSYGLGKVTPQPSFSVSDGSGYSSLISAAFGPPNWAMVDISARYNVTAGTHSIVSTNSAGSTLSYGFCTAMEWSGLSGAADILLTNGSASAGSPTTGTTGAVASTNEVAIACFCYRVSAVETWSEPAGYTNVAQNKDGTSGPQMVGSVDYQVPVPSGAQSASWGSFSGGQWAALIALLEFAPSTVPAGGLFVIP